jgi:hypothetical protein
MTSKRRIKARQEISLFQIKLMELVIFLLWNSMYPQRDKIIPTQNYRFKDTSGKPIKRYECKITHLNNSREQTWTVSKTVCLQIIEQLRNRFTVLKVTRQGTDRSTTYTIEGVQ